MVATVVIAAGCDSAVGSESPNVGHSYIVGVDISGSRTKAEMDESKKLLDGLIDRLQAGDHLTLIEVYQGGRTPARQWTDSIRSPRKAGQLTGTERTPATKRPADAVRCLAGEHASFVTGSVLAVEGGATAGIM